MARGHLALHRLLRRVLPARVRQQRGADMDRTFLSMLERDDRGRLRLWAGELRDLLATGSKLRGKAVRARWRASLPTTSWLDIKLGLRILAKHPGLTAVALFALAIGIPAGLAPWHLINAVEGPLPVADGERVMLARYWNDAAGRAGATRIDELHLWRDALSSFAVIGGTRRALYNVRSGEEPAQAIRGAEVTASTFDVLRTPPLHGRALVAADEIPGAPEVVVIGYDTWRTRFGADPGAVGTALRIGEATHTVVGVMPEGFRFPVREQLWLPLREQPGELPFQGSPLSVFGRLADGVSAADAQTELGAVVRQTRAEFPDSHEHLRGEVVPFSFILLAPAAGGVRAELGFYAVQVLTLLLLLIACTNVGMLIFARTATRSEELAVRATLGAGRARIVGQMLTEAAVLSLAAVGVGLLVADQGLRILQRNVESGMPYWIDLSVSYPTVARALGLALFSAVAAGLFPALKVTGKGLQRGLQSGAVRLTGARFGGVSSVLIVLDVAMAVIIIGVGIAAIDNLTTINSNEALGIEPGEYLSASIRLPELEPAADAEAADREAFLARIEATQRALVQRLEAEPGVRGVAIGNRLPRMDHPGRRVTVEGEEVGEGFRGHVVQVARVDAGFFRALGTPILLGRGFDSRDIGDNRSTVIVNTTFVDQVLGGRNPIGQRVRYAAGARLSGADSLQTGGETSPWLEIVGVVPRLGMNMVAPAQDAGLYQPLAPGELHPMLIGIRLGDDPASFAPRLRELVVEVDANAVAVSVVPLDEVVQDDLFAAYLMTTGGALLVAILVMVAASGIYAIMSFTVAARTREIGVRTSLGAKRRDIVRTISGRAFIQLGVGALLGLSLTWRLLSMFQNGAGWIPGYSPFLVALLAALGVALLIGLPSCLAPTLRALRIIPTEAMRGGC